MSEFVRSTEAPRPHIELSARVDPAKAIRRAQRNSRMVRFMSWAIVVICAVAIGSVGFIAYFDPFKRLPGKISVGHVGLSGTLVTMQSPKTIGMRPNGQPFELNSVSGTQDILKPDVVTLHSVSAKLGMDDSSTSTITAKEGVYNGKKEMIWLKGNVHIVNSAGYDMHMPTATVNIKSSALETKDPVLVVLNGGKVQADSMDIEDNGHKITFVGRVHSVVDSHISVDAAEAANGSQPQAEASQ
jgi:lipopolysaccharide export system protein LptC